MIQVHHIIPRSVKVDHSIDNLISVCVRCHNAIDHLTSLGYRKDPNFDPARLLSLIMP